MADVRPRRDDRGRPARGGVHRRRHLHRVRHPGLPQPRRGLEPDEPIYFQDFVASEERRREAWTRAFSGAAGWTGAEPNAGHYAVARLVGPGKARAVITQNVDNLHQDSGVPEDRVDRAARQRQLRHLPGVRPAPRAGRPEGAVPGARRHPRLPGLRRHRQDRHHLVRPADAGGGRWRGPRRRRWPATSSWCWARRWWSIPAAGFPLLAKQQRRGAGHRQPRAHRPGRLRRPGAARRDRPGDDRRRAEILVAANRLVHQAIIANSSHCPPSAFRAPMKDLFDDPSPRRRNGGFPARRRRGQRPLLLPPSPPPPSPSPLGPVR